MEADHGARLIGRSRPLIFDERWRTDSPMNMRYLWSLCALYAACTTNPRSRELSFGSEMGKKKRNTVEEGSEGESLPLAMNWKGEAKNVEPSIRDDKFLSRLKRFRGDRKLNFSSSFSLPPRFLRKRLVSRARITEISRSSGSIERTCNLDVARATMRHFSCEKSVRNRSPFQFCRLSSYTTSISGPV